LARHQEGDRLRPDYSPAFQPIGTVNTLGIREYVEQYHGLQFAVAERIDSIRRVTVVPPHAEIAAIWPLLMPLLWPAQASRVAVRVVFQNRRRRRHQQRAVRSGAGCGGSSAQQEIVRRMLLLLSRIPSGGDILNVVDDLVDIICFGAGPAAVLIASWRRGGGGRRMSRRIWCWLLHRWLGLAPSGPAAKVDHRARHCVVAESRVRLVVLGLSQTPLFSAESTAETALNPLSDFTFLPAGPAAFWLGSGGSAASSANSSGASGGSHIASSFSFRSSLSDAAREGSVAETSAFELPRSLGVATRRIGSPSGLTNRFSTERLPLIGKEPAASGSGPTSCSRLHSAGWLSSRSSGIGRGRGGGVVALDIAAEWILKESDECGLAMFSRNFHTVSALGCDSSETPCGPPRTSSSISTPRFDRGRYSRTAGCCCACCGGCCIWCGCGLVSRFFLYLRVSEDPVVKSRSSASKKSPPSCASPKEPSPGPGSRPAKSGSPCDEADLLRQSSNSRNSPTVMLRLSSSRISSSTLRFGSLVRLVSSVSHLRSSCAASLRASLLSTGSIAWRSSSSWAGFGHGYLDSSGRTASTQRLVRPGEPVLGRPHRLGAAGQTGLQLGRVAGRPLTQRVIPAASRRLRRRVCRHCQPAHLLEQLATLGQTSRGRRRCLQPQPLLGVFSGLLAGNVGTRGSDALGSGCRFFQAFQSGLGGAPVDAELPDANELLLGFAPLPAQQLTQFVKFGNESLELVGMRRQLGIFGQRHQVSVELGSPTGLGETRRPLTCSVQQQPGCHLLESVLHPARLRASGTDSVMLFTCVSTSSNDYNCLGLHTHVKRSCLSRISGFSTEEALLLVQAEHLLQTLHQLFALGRQDVEDGYTTAVLLLEETKLINTCLQQLQRVNNNPENRLRAGPEVGQKRQAAHSLLRLGDGDVIFHQSHQVRAGHAVQMHSDEILGRKAGNLWHIRHILQFTAHSWAKLLHVGPDRQLGSRHVSMKAVSHHEAASAASSSRPHSPSASSVASSQLDAIYRGNLPADSDDPDAAELSSSLGDTLERENRQEDQRRYLQQLSDIGRQIQDELQPNALVDVGCGGGTSTGNSDADDGKDNAADVGRCAAAATTGAPSRFSRIRKIKVIDSRSRTAVSSGESTPRRRSRHRSRASSSPSRSRSSSAAPVDRHGSWAAQADSEAFLPVAQLQQPSGKLSSLERLRGPPRDPLRPRRRSQSSGGSRSEMKPDVELESEPKPEPDLEPEPLPPVITEHKAPATAAEMEKQDANATRLHVQMSLNWRQPAVAERGPQVEVEELEEEPAARRRKLPHPPPPERQRPTRATGEQGPLTDAQWGLEVAAEWGVGSPAEQNSAHAGVHLSSARVQLGAAAHSSENNELWPQRRKSRPEREAEQQQQQQQPKSQVEEQLRQLFTYSNSPLTVGGSNGYQTQRPPQEQLHQQGEDVALLGQRKKRPLPPPAPEYSAAMATATALSVSADEADDDDDDDAVFEAVDGLVGDDRWHQNHHQHQPKRGQQYQHRYQDSNHQPRRQKPDQREHQHKQHQHYQNQEQRDSTAANSQSSSLPTSIRTSDLYPKGSETLTDAYRYRPSTDRYAAQVNLQYQRQEPPPQQPPQLTSPVPPVPPRRQRRSAAVAESSLSRQRSNSLSSIQQSQQQPTYRQRPMEVPAAAAAANGNGRIGGSDTDDSDDPINERHRAALKLPSNAVKVLPTGAASLRRNKQESLLSPRGATAGDPVSEIEGLCRQMQLQDDDLLDGAERHDTLARVQTRLAKLSSGGDEDDVFAASSGSHRQQQQLSPARPQAGQGQQRAAYFVQHRGAFPDKELDDQARRHRLDSQRRYGGPAESLHHSQHQIGWSVNAAPTSSESRTALQAVPSSRSASSSPAQQQSTKFILCNLETEEEEEDAEVSDDSSAEDDNERSSSLWLWVSPRSARPAEDEAATMSSQHSGPGEVLSRSADNTACLLSDASALSDNSCCDCDSDNSFGTEEESVAVTTERTEEVVVKSSPMPLRRVASAGDVGGCIDNAVSVAKRGFRPRFWKTVEVRFGSDADIPAAVQSNRRRTPCLSSYFVQVGPPLPPQSQKCDKEKQQQQPPVQQQLPDVQQDKQDIEQQKQSCQRQEDARDA
uniref:Calpain catalytic domain-containing protein n=1 Tax=Macrostomum lignano TaxID=282301 RepID=A0A1I8H0P7_9PLAT